MHYEMNLKSTWDTNIGLGLFHFHLQKQLSYRWIVTNSVCRFQLFFIFYFFDVFI